MKCYITDIAMGPLNKMFYHWLNREQTLTVILLILEVSQSAMYLKFWNNISF